MDRPAWPCSSKATQLAPCLDKAHRPCPRRFVLIIKCCYEFYKVVKKVEFIFYLTSLKKAIWSFIKSCYKIIYVNIIFIYLLMHKPNFILHQPYCTKNLSLT